VISLGKSARGGKFRSDREFLPAALAILETPPSPIRIWLIWTICLLFSFAIGWSYFSRIDIIATAQGKFQPTGRVKTVEPVEAGKVSAIHLENGRHVSQGDVLIELDPSEANADAANAKGALQGFRAERERRLAALRIDPRLAGSEPTKIAWPDDLPASTRLREERVLSADLAQLAATARSFDAQIAEKEAEQARLEGTITAQQVLLATLRERVNMRTVLLGRGAGSRASVIDAEEALETQLTTLAAQQGQVLEARASAAVLVEERSKAIEAFKADNSEKLDEAERQIDDLTQRAAKADARLGHMTITSPVSGVVMGLSVTTVGQAVSPSEELMRIVPDGSDLEIECYVENKDIGFVEVGQPAVVKIESFPFTRYGVVNATVTQVARDAIPEPDAQAVEGNPAKTTKSSFFGGAQRTQNLVFPVTLSPSSKTIEIDGSPVPLTPGMAVSVEVKTGKRRILEFLFSPLVQTASSAMKER